ncbi:MAG: hypothetical protein SF053_00495 [Bacteroidia bacterium]|nr:hypothetical protein [Bacteroidia bacterium]
MKNLVFIAIIGMFASCSPVKKGLLNESQAPVFEIAVRKVKDGMKENFVASRADFITALKAQDGVSNDREFQSFYALPEPDQQEVFIGMTQYATGQTVGKVQGNVLGKFMKFAKTMDLKAYVFVQPIEGGTFDLGKLAAKPGQVLELAVRRVKPGQEAAFQSSRSAFVSWLNGQAGVAGSWEFKVVGGKDVEGLTVGMSVYESQEAFQAIAGKVQSLPEAGAYFSTFDPVALQYAISASNL